MTEINDIKKSALTHGACDKINDVRTVADAINLLQTPQGREFALKTGFPTLEDWRSVADRINMVDVFVDCGEVEVSDCDFIAVGNSRVKASFSSPKQLYHIITMHGAEVLIEANNYAVVNVTLINSTARQDMRNDGTAIVTIEQSEKGGNQ